jgi:pimeloyl-ACP methyl ester carboxylesterase
VLAGACVVVMAISVLLASFQLPPHAHGKERPMRYPNFYRTIQIDGLSIFYREAGPKDAPTLLMLHGLPSSSRMFEPLFTRLSDRYHLVAPDYPGFGHSDWPDPRKFAYTFDHYAEIMNHLTEALGLSRYTLYMQDYGGPVGFRMALTHPDRIEALIVQDAVAHNDGLGANWRTRRAFWADRGANESALRTNLLSLATTRTRHVGNDPNMQRYDPDLWTDEFYFLNQPGQADIQSDLFYDYRTNVDSYPKWQAWMREKQPRLLVIWGKYDLSLTLANLSGTGRMFRMPKFTFSMPVISHWTRLQMRLPHWSGPLPLLHAMSCSRGAPADAAVENAGCSARCYPAQAQATARRRGGWATERSSS